MRSQSSMISAMLWSIRSTPAPCSALTERTTAANSGISASGRPGGGLVHQHEATARWRAPARRRAGARRRARAPPRARRRSGRARAGDMSASARRAASRGAAPTPSAETSTFSRTERSRNDAAVLERAREAVAAAAMRRPARDVALAERDRALVGRSKPLSTLTSVDLPAPFGPIRPTISPRCSSSVTPRERAHALERTGNGGGPERRSGPRLRFGLWFSRQPAVRSSGRPWR